MRAPVADARGALVPRRTVLKAGAAGTALVATGTVPSIVRAAPATAAARAPFASDDPNDHLLRRATFGATGASRKELKRLGREEWLDRQLHPERVRDTAGDDIVGRFPDLGWSIPTALERLDGSWQLMFDLGVSTLARAAWSERQLLEVMVDFWSNHLNVTNPSDMVWFSRHDYDRVVIRKHALGKFSQMLAASARHPSMLLYLNNAESTFESPNENYGRELLELHSVGVNGGYDEDDMRNSALVMTGFGIDWDTGLYEYHPWAHHVGRVTVMKWSSRNASPNGQKVGLDYVDFLAHHPSTAEHIATKLVRRFVSDEAPRGLVDALAEVYLDNDTAIVPVLRTLFRSKTFGGSVGAKVRRPLEDLVATVRTLGTGPDRNGVDGLIGLYWMVQGLGHAPLAWTQPDGYPDVADAWRSAGGMVSRWNSHMSLAGHWWPEELEAPNLKRLVPDPLPNTHGALVDALARGLVFRKLSKSHRAAVLGFIGRTAGDPLSKDDEAVGWRLPYLVALILDSPYHMVR